MSFDAQYDNYKAHLWKMVGLPPPHNTPAAPLDLLGPMVQEPLELSGVPSKQITEALIIGDKIVYLSFSA